MTNNVAPLDQAIRAGVGLFLLASPLLELRTYPFNLLGLVLVGTALAGYCPLYSALSWLSPRAHLASVKR
jgi:hypothetical protein